jgi:diguanylate cyclase (GGDEF)-like protein
VPASIDFGPYAQILRTLMPRVRGVYLYAPDSDLLWSSEGADYSDLRPAIEELLTHSHQHADQTGFRRMIDDTPAFCFLLRDSLGVVLAVVAVLFRPPSREGELPPFDIVERTLAPLLTLARREFATHRALEAAGSPVDAPTPSLGTPDAASLPPDAGVPIAPAAALAPAPAPAHVPPPANTGATTILAALGDSARLYVPAPDQPDVADTQELQWLLELAHLEAPAEPGADALQALLDAFAVRSDCDVALLFVPGRRLERSVTRAQIPAAEIEALRAVVARHLFRVAQLQQKTLIVNKVRETGAGGLVPYRILCVPFARRGQVIGVAVAFNRAAGRPFEMRDARMLERLVPRLQEVIDVRFDEITGLPTRHAFEEHASLALARRPNAARCIVYADVDQVHVVNDLFGFAAGDEVLRDVGDAWRDVPLPPGSCVARISGDRFVALLEDCTVSRAAAWAEQARASIASRPPPQRCTGLRISASLGVAAVEGSLEHALVGAQTACKAAKDRGRDRVQAFDTTDPSLVQRHDELRVYRDLVDAFEQGRFRLYAQPIVPLWDPTRATRYEILVRLLDAQGQPVAPDRFLQAAARYQLLPQLDRWVLDETLRSLQPDAAALADAGATFSINLSEASVADAGFPEHLAGRLAATGVPGALLGLELAESHAIARLPAAEQLIAAAARLGCPCAIDDFGTGLSSLANLKSLPVGALKIDGLFVRDLLTNPRSEAMIRAILQIARQLEVDTVAECVETAEVASHLATLGVTYGQGWAFAQPRPLEDVLAEAVRKAGGRAAAAVSGLDAPLPPGLPHVH